MLAVDDLTAWGDGWTNALCVLRDAQPVQGRQQDYQLTGEVLDDHGNPILDAAGRPIVV